MGNTYSSNTNPTRHTLFVKELEGEPGPYDIHRDGAHGIFRVGDFHKAEEHFKIAVSNITTGRFTTKWRGVSSLRGEREKDAHGTGNLPISTA